MTARGTHDLETLRGLASEPNAALPAAAESLGAHLAELAGRTDIDPDVMRIAQRAVVLLEELPSGQPTDDLREDLRVLHQQCDTAPPSGTANIGLHIAACNLVSAAHSWASDIPDPDGDDWSKQFDSVLGGLLLLADSERG